MKNTEPNAVKRKAPAPGVITSIKNMEGKEFHTIIGSIIGEDQDANEVPFLPGLSVHYWCMKSTDVDAQKPHFQDEVYMVLEGSGEINIDGEFSKLSKGDLVFVPALMEHHFITDQEDLRMLIFFGPDYCGRDASSSPVVPG